MAPLARTEELVVKTIDDEAVIFDLRNHQASCLNRAALTLWQQCDGRRSVTDLARALEMDEATTWVNLRTLQHAGLLDSCPPIPPGIQSADRHRLRRRLIALGLLAMMESIIAPTAQSATVSCPVCTNTCTAALVGCPCSPGHNGSCTSGKHCQSNLSCA